MDNFNNLLQIPILFYIFCLTLNQQPVVNVWFVVVAWIYVILRLMHSVIQLSHNTVKYRFYAWLASNLILLGLWLAVIVS